jgi:hypothetical protein
MIGLLSYSFEIPLNLLVSLFMKLNHANPEKDQQKKEKIIQSAIKYRLPDKSFRQ